MCKLYTIHVQPKPETYPVQFYSAAFETNNLVDYNPMTYSNSH